MALDLTDDEKAASIELLRGTIDLGPLPVIAARASGRPFQRNPCENAGRERRMHTIDNWR